SSITVSIQPIPAPGKPILVRNDWYTYLEKIVAVENGISTKDSQYPNGVKTSSNLAFAQLANNPSNIRGEFGIMIRSFSYDEMHSIADRITKTLAEAFSSSQNSQIIADVHPWQALPNSKLVQEALSGKYFFRTQEFLNGAIETSIWTKKYPHL